MRQNKTQRSILFVTRKLSLSPGFQNPALTLSLRSGTQRWKAELRHEIAGPADHASCTRMPCFSCNGTLGNKPGFSGLHVCPCSPSLYSQRCFSERLPELCVPSSRFQFFVAWPLTDKLPASSQSGAFALPTLRGVREGRNTQGSVT